MGLLSSIAAALSEGVGNGMVANAKWGIAEDEQAKKEAAENSRLEKTLAKYDADRELREKIYGMQAEEGKADREARAKESAADRDLQWRIANLNHSRQGGGMGSAADARAGLEMLDTTIRGIDAERARLAGKLEGADASTAKEIQVSIDALSSQRENLLNSSDANNIWAANGDIGRAHRAQFFTNTEDEKTESSDKIPESLVVPPPRTAHKEVGTLSGGLLAKMQELDSGKQQATNIPAEQTGNHDLSSYADRIRNGSSQTEKPDWNSVKKPKGGWSSPITTKEVQYKNGQKGYTFGWSD